MCVSVSVSARDSRLCECVSVSVSARDSRLCECVCVSVSVCVCVYAQVHHAMMHEYFAVCICVCFCVCVCVCMCACLFGGGGVARESVQFGLMESKSVVVLGVRVTTWCVHPSPVSHPLAYTRRTCELVRTLSRACVLSVMHTSDWPDVEVDARRAQDTPRCAHAPSVCCRLREGKSVFTSCERVRMSSV